MPQQESNEQHYQRMMSQSATLMVMRYLHDLVEDGVDRKGLEIMFLEESEKPENQQIPFSYITNLVRTRYEKSKTEAGLDPQ